MSRNQHEDRMDLWVQILERSVQWAPLQSGGGVIYYGFFFFKYDAQNAMIQPEMLD